MIINSAARFCDISVMLPLFDSLIQLTRPGSCVLKQSHYWILCGKENCQIMQKNLFSSHFSMGNCLTLHKATRLLCISIAQAIVIRFMSVSMTWQKTLSEKNAIAMSLILFVLVPSLLVRGCYQLNKTCVYKGPGRALGISCRSWCASYPFFMESHCLFFILFSYLFYIQYGK